MIIHVDGWDDGNKFRCDIDLEALCEAETEYWSDKVIGGFNHKRKGFKTYPLNKAKKLLKLIAENVDQNKIDEIQKYLDDHSKQYGKIFRKVTEDVGR